MGALFGWRVVGLLTHPPTPLTHSLTHPLIHSLAHSLAHPPTVSHSLTHPPTHSPTHSSALTHSLTHPLTHSHAHSLILVLTLTHSLTHSLTHPCTGALCGWLIVARGSGDLIPHKVFLNSSRRSRLPHKSVNLSFTITSIKNEPTDLCGN